LIGKASNYYQQREGAQDGQSLAGDGTFWKGRRMGRPRASADYNYSEGDKTNGRVGGSWIQIINVGSIMSTAVDQ